MADEKRSKAKADPASKKMPEGLRVVRKRRKKRESTGSRQTLFLKKRDILRDMHHESGVVGVKAQVERLKSARKVKDDDKPVEERWGGRPSRRRGARWVLLCVFALAVPVLAICTAFILIQGGKGTELNRGDDELEFNVDPEDPILPTGPLVWFNDNPHEAYDAALAILKALNEEGKAPLSAQLFRNGEETLGKIAESGIGWSSKFFTADPREFSWMTGSTGDVGYLVFEGIREDKSKFRTYFAKTDRGLRLDWEASTGRSDFPFEELEKGGIDGPVLVRCRLLKEPHFDTEQGEPSKQSWYLLRGPDADTNLWGYVEKDSSLDAKLRRLFGYGMVVLERESEVRATLRIVKPESTASAKEYRITELVTREWVVPEAQPASEADPARASERKTDSPVEERPATDEEPALDQQSATDEEVAAESEPATDGEFPAERDPGAESSAESAGGDRLAK